MSGDVDEKFVVNLKFGISTTGVHVGTLNHASIEYTHAILLLENVSLLQNYFSLQWKHSRSLQILTRLNTCSKLDYV